MVAPSLISTRRFPQPVRQQLQAAFARAWEALAETHQTQAVQFVLLLADRLSGEDALHRYFREVAVPALMQETVRARALLQLQGVMSRELESATTETLNYLRPDQLLEALRRRTQFVEEINLSCRLAAALSDEAVALTHVRNALDVAEQLTETMPIDEGLMQYIRSFDLPSMPAQVVFQRALARMAERHPVLRRAPAAATAPATAPATATAPDATRALRAPRLSGAELSLRAVG
jgi:hypothetical protein